ncbi:MAG: SHOCT domain-containing protein [Proteobacteria bacterium]|nr:SHOCT domain-containing protein [Pseudomonadota bacterium]
MAELSAEGQRIVDDVARRHGVSSDTVRLLLESIARGGGTQAQFNLMELGGMGQWSQGGMIMVGDMFNNGLKARVDQLCNELSGIWRSTTVYAAPVSSQSQSQGGGYSGQWTNTQGSSLYVPSATGSGGWWPAGLGSPSSVGSQNDLHYAVFPATQRLAVSIGGQVSVYDTGNHQIGGVSQQQGGPGQSVTFTSQYGTVRTLDLPLVSGPGSLPQPVPATPPPEPQSSPPAAATSAPASMHEDIFAKIERLGELKQKGLITEDEFATKKAELLGRL